MLDKVFSKIFGDPIPPELCGQFKDTFCYLSIKDRHPVTLTKVGYFVVTRCNAFNKLKYPPENSRK